MNSYHVVTSIWFWIITIPAIAVCFAGRFVKCKKAQTILSAAYIALCLALIVFMLIMRAQTKEVYFAMLLIVTASLALTGRSKKKEEDDKDDI